MTRKDYVAIAAALKRASANVQARGTLACDAKVFCEYVATTMAADNPAFDRARFLKACGVQS